MDSGPLTLGRHPDGAVTVTDGGFTVADEAVARRLAEYYPNLEYDGAVDDEASSDTTASSDDGQPPDAICGAEMSDGEICERPADECPYHGED